jgi:hypothetical protein
VRLRILSDVEISSLANEAEPLNMRAAGKMAVDDLLKIDLDTINLIRPALSDMNRKILVHETTLPNELALDTDNVRKVAPCRRLVPAVLPRRHGHLPEGDAVTRMTTTELGRWQPRPFMPFKD